MTPGRLATTLLFATGLAALAPAGPGWVEWGGAEARAGKKKRRAKKAPPMRGHNVAAADLRTEPVPAPSGDVWLYSENFREEVRVNIYGKGGGPGRYDEEALAALDTVFRCKRTGDRRAVDPRLYDSLSAISDHFGGKRIELVSGFRFQRNEGSRHYHASAMDIRIEGVSIRELHGYAESLDTGGMGIGLYPRAGFVHVDWRAPGEPSYRWVDRSRPDGGNAGNRPSRRARSRRPAS
jgi:uncharacterized protein YcbK (DUF882 family)